jgi:hypothetical protein
MTLRFSRKRRSPAERFWEKVIPEPNSGCWLWMGALIGNGYGLLGGGPRGSKALFAHRFSWELHNGLVPDGLWVLHRCDVRHCVNPAHLFLGDRTENIRDMYAKGRALCQQHPERMAHGVGHPNARLNDENVREARALAAHGVPVARIALRFGVSESAIHSIVRRITWKHVEDRHV